MSSWSDKGEGSLGKTCEDAKVVGKVKTTQAPYSMPKSSDLITSITTTTTRIMTKGFVIGGSNSSSITTPPKITKADKSKGNGISVEPTLEEKKVAIKAEMEKQRKI